MIPETDKPNPARDLLRRLFSANMPPVVTQELVPQVWKEKWLPMQPFFVMG